MWRWFLLHQMMRQQSVGGTRYGGSGVALVVVLLGTLILVLVLWYPTYRILGVKTDPEDAFFAACVVAGIAMLSLLIFRVI